MPDLLLTSGFHATPHRFLWHPATATAIIADLHLGIEATLNDHGIALPEMNLRAMRPRWEALVARLNAHQKSHLVIAGDLFDSPTPGAGTIAAARALLAEVPCAVTLIPGNHDPSADQLQFFFPGSRITDQAALGGYAILHGHRMAPSDARGLIVGHQHPCVVLADRIQSAKMICFATCEVQIHKRSVPLLILPTFSSIPLGSNLLNPRHWILDFPCPAPSAVRIAGIVEGSHTQPPQVLDFGTLAEH